MRFLKNANFDTALAILWDTDALNLAFTNPALLPLLYDNSNDKLFLLTIPICSEFYSSEKGFNPLVAKRLFLKNNTTRFFVRHALGKTANSQIEDNIIQLKRLYIGLGLPGQPSYQDLYLQAYALLLGEKVLILTRNINDWNSKIFQVEGMIDFEMGTDKSARILLYFLSINRVNFDKAVEEYNTKEKALIEEISTAQTRL